MLMIIVTFAFEALSWIFVFVFQGWRLEIEARSGSDCVNKHTSCGCLEVIFVHAFFSYFLLCESVNVQDDVKALLWVLSLLLSIFCAFVLYIYTTPESLVDIFSVRISCAFCFLVQHSCSLFIVINHGHTHELAVDMSI